MRLLGKIAYWLAALTLLSAILVSLDYSLVQAVLISLIFGPCALALEYLMPKARKPMDKVYLSLAVLVAVIVLILFHEERCPDADQPGFPGADPHRAVHRRLLLVQMAGRAVQGARPDRHFLLRAEKRDLTPL